MEHYTKAVPMLLPRQGIDLTRWAVVACDQYTSQPEYWNQLEEQVGQNPSTLRLILPEVWLEEPDAHQRMQAVWDTMEAYQRQGLLLPTPPGMMLVQRQMEGMNQPRTGLVMAFDLEAYDYREGAEGAIRPTEKTVEERIPQRLAVRKKASLELPHILLLVDDPEDTVIQPLVEMTTQLQQVYDVPLLAGGGRVTGWFVPEGPLTQQVQQALVQLAQPERFASRYGISEDMSPVLFATGDGNHSMAAAKASWEEIRKELTPEERQQHPARWVLAELVNLNQQSLEIEPIHRLLFGASLQQVQQQAQAFFKKHGAQVEFWEQPTQPDGWTIPLVAGQQRCWMQLKQSPWALPIGAIQAFLADYLAQQPKLRLDYIHGEDTLCSLAAEPDCVGFILPDLEKRQIFEGVIKDGVLPRKTFSMGRAQDKRYYLEARRIQPQPHHKL